jgi:hypothetical protein
MFRVPTKWFQGETLYNVQSPYKVVPMRNLTQCPDPLQIGSSAKTYLMSRASTEWFQSENLLDVQSPYKVVPVRNPTQCPEPLQSGSSAKTYSMFRVLSIVFTIRFLSTDLSVSL